MCVSTCQLYLASRYTHGVTANQIYIDTSPCLKSYNMIYGHKMHTKKQQQSGNISYAFERNNANTHELFVV